MKEECIMSIFERMAEGAGIGATTGIAKDINDRRQYEVTSQL